VVFWFFLRDRVARPVCCTVASTGEADITVTDTGANIPALFFWPCWPVDEPVPGKVVDMVGDRVAAVLSVAPVAGTSVATREAPVAMAGTGNCPA
jgi:hypothetical protein